MGIRISSSRLALTPFLIVLVALGVAGCSSVQLAYNNLDRISRWAAGEYIRMDSAQRRYFDGAVADVLYWHRTRHLPEYADFLEAVDVLLADGTDADEIDAMVDVVLRWAEEIERWAVPIAAELLMSLSDAQVAELAVRLEDSNREWAEPEAGKDVEAARDAWQKQFTERFARFSGRLTRAQRAYLAAQAGRYVPERVLWVEYRGRWQADLLERLADRGDTERFAAEFASLAREREAYMGAAFIAVSEHNDALAREASVWLVNHLTPRQRAHFSQRLQDLAADFRTLSSAPVVAPTERACLVTC